MWGQCIDLLLYAQPWFLYSSQPPNYGKWAVYFFLMSMILVSTGSTIRRTCWPTALLLCPIQNIFFAFFSIRFNRMFVNRPHRKRETGRQIQPFKLRQDQCDHIWWNFATPAKKLKVFCNFFDGVFSTEQNYEHTLANFLGMLWSKNSLLETAKYWTNNSAIWSHWTWLNWNNLKIPGAGPEDPIFITRIDLFPSSVNLTIFRH